MKAKTISKKVLALLITLMMTIGLAVSASAASITINGNDGEAYTAYKVLDVTTATETTTDPETQEATTIIGYNYTTDNEALVEYLTSAGFTVTNNGGLYYVTAPADDEETTDEDEWQACADALTTALAALSETELEALLGEAAGEVTLDGTTGSIIELEAGYYFVTSSLGSLCMLNTAADTVTITEKNEEPTVEKEVSDADAQIGDTVTYTVTINVPANTETLVLNDTLSNGLTLDANSFTVAIDTLDPLPPVTDPGVTSNDDGTTSFTLDLTAYVAEMSEDATITITYTATINENAIHTNPATNKAYIEYGNDSSSVSTEATTYTHAIYLTKVDEDGNKLDGAEFQLTDEDGNLVYVIPVYDEEGYLSYYRFAFTSEEEIVDSAFYQGATSTIVVTDGYVVIDGLDAGTYYLTETKAPDGYNLLTDKVTVNIADGGVDVNGTVFGTFANITVTNSTGSQLPSTGGTGTTVIYIVGALLVIGAGVTLVVRRRMNAK